MWKNKLFIRCGNNVPISIAEFTFDYAFAILNNLGCPSLFNHPRIIMIFNYKTYFLSLFILIGFFCSCADNLI